MNKVFFFLLSIGIVSMLSSCEVEKIQPNEIQDPNLADMNDTNPPDVTPPCILDSNKVRFAFTNYTMTNPILYSPAINPIGNSDYQISTSSGPIDMDIYFQFEPKTGFYITHSTTNSLPDSTNVYMRIFLGGTNYYPLSGDTVYVLNTGNSIKISFCSMSFNGGQNTFTDNYGQIVLFD